MKKYLLIVEDDETAIKIIDMTAGRIARALGLEVIQCKSIADIEEKFPIDYQEHSIIILDVDLGNETTRGIADDFSDELKKNTVVTTSDEDEKIELKNEGFSSFIKKTDIVALRETVKELLNVVV